MACDYFLHVSRTYPYINKKTLNPTTQRIVVVATRAKEKERRKNTSWSRSIGRCYRAKWPVPAFRHSFSEGSFCLPGNLGIRHIRDIQKICLFIHPHNRLAPFLTHHQMNIVIDGCDRAIPNPNRLIESFVYKIKCLLKNNIWLYSPGSHASSLNAGL